MSTASNPAVYDESDFDVLEGLEPVRQVPGMYTRTKNPLHVTQEVLDNAIDEAQNGHANRVELTVHKDGSVSVADNGRGIPVGLHPKQNIPVVVLAFTKLHAGAKFRKGNSYARSGGLHGVGVSVTNALSTRLEVEVKREGQVHKVQFADGDREISPVSLVGECGPRTSGTRVRFWPNAQYFDSPALPAGELEHLLRSKAMLLPGLTVKYVNEITGAEQSWCYTEGLSAYLRERLDGLEQVGDAFQGEGKVASADSEGVVAGDGASWAVAWTTEAGKGESYVNLIPTPLGGTHEAGLRTGLFEAIRDYCEHHALLPRGVTLQAEDVWGRAHFVLSAHITHTQFQGQTKDKLTSREVVRVVSSVVKDPFMHWLLANPESAKKIAELVIRQATSRLRQGKVVEKRKSSGVATLPGKLTDCQITDITRNELFLVEGDSAGGGCKTARDRVYQAILPLRGKVLNTWEVARGELFANQEVHDISVALGIDPHDADAPETVLDNLRYGKVILMSLPGDELVMVRTSAGARHVPIGDFVEKHLTRAGRTDKAASRVVKGDFGEVLSFDPKMGTTKWAPVRAVIAHRNEEPLISLRTRGGRRIRITAGHSVFLWSEAKGIHLKPGDEIQPGDYLLTPRHIPVPFESRSALDLIAVLLAGGHGADIWVGGPAVEEIFRNRRNATSSIQRTQPRVSFDEEFAAELYRLRKLSGHTVEDLLKLSGLKGKRSVYDLESARNSVSLPVLAIYLAALGTTLADMPGAYRLQDPLADQYARDTRQAAVASKNQLRTQALLAEFTEDELDLIKSCQATRLYTGKHRAHAVPAWLPVTEDLAFALGFWLAEGSASPRRGVAWACGKPWLPTHEHLQQRLSDGLGVPVTFYQTHATCGELRLHNMVMGRVITSLMGSAPRSWNKFIPDQVFAWPETLRLAVLQGLLMGDGTLTATGLAYSTSSAKLYAGVAALLQSLGVTPVAMNSRDPEEAPVENKWGICRKRTIYHLAVTNRDDLAKIEPAWVQEARSAELKERIAASRPNINTLGVGVSSDLLAVQVTEISIEENNTEVVYDLSVTGTEAFIAGTGGLCCHNSDADVDGSHIQTLLLTLFFKHFPQLVARGHVFIAKPPLFRVDAPAKGRSKPAQKLYCLTEQERDETIAQLLRDGFKREQLTVSRFKGLGEMMPAQLKDTCLSPDTRLLLPVRVSDLEAAARMFQMLMAKGEAAGRRSWLEAKGGQAELDI